MGLNCRFPTSLPDAVTSETTAPPSCSQRVKTEKESASPVGRPRDLSLQMGTQEQAHNQNCFLSAQQRERDHRELPEKHIRLKLGIENNIVLPPRSAGSKVCSD